MGNWTIPLGLVVSNDSQTTVSSTPTLWSLSLISRRMTSLKVKCSAVCFRLLAFASNKENKTDTLIYVAKLIGSGTGAKVDSSPFNLPSRIVTPTMGKGTSRWMAESISIDDRYILLTKFQSASYRPLYIVDISGDGPAEPQLVTLPNSTEKEGETFCNYARFSRDPSDPHLVYLITNAYGDFKSVVMYNSQTHTVSHITTPAPNLRAIRPISWETEDLKVTRENIFFRANIEGWSHLFVMPLSGPHRDTVIEVKPDWEGGNIKYVPNSFNGKPNELVLKLVSYRSQGSIVRLDIAAALEKIDFDESGEAYTSVTLSTYHQASSEIPPFRTLPPKLMRFKSFDGLPIPVMYYHPNNMQSVVPLVINIHGGPEVCTSSPCCLLFIASYSNSPLLPTRHTESGYCANSIVRI
jgi:hypothetical protein